MYNRARPFLPAIPYLIGVGLQVSGRTHAGLALLAFEIAAVIAAGVVWSYWIDWRQTALAGGHPNKIAERALIWPGFNFPRLPSIRGELLAAILTFLICNAAIFAFFELTEVPRSGSAKRWEPLSAQETMALREQWRSFSPEHLGVLCAIPACAELAESVYGVANGLDWPAAYQSTYFTDETGIHAGIEIWSYGAKASIRDKIADSIERATNRRLMIHSHEYPWQGTQPIPPEMENQINLIIGRLK